MQDQRQPFRFRLPWLSAMNAPRPTPEPQPSRPTPEIQAPAQSTTAPPIQRPPFRPAGIAPVQPPPQAQPTIRTETQPPPSRPTTESRVASQPASPSRATQTRAASVPPPPTRGATDSRVASQPASPSRATTQTPVASQTRSPSRAATQSRAASVPPSPSRTTQPATQAGPKPRSPSRLAPQSTGQTSSQPSSPMRKVTPPQVQPAARAISQPSSPRKKSEPSTQETSQPSSSVPQEQEAKPVASLQPPQEPQPKAQIKPEIVPESQYKTAGETTFKPDRVASQPTQASGLVASVAPTATVAPEAPAASRKLDLIPTEAGHPMPFPGSEKMSEETHKNNLKIERKKNMEERAQEDKSEDRKEVAKELVKEEKTNGSADEQMPRTVTKHSTAASGLEAQIKELLGARIGTEERKQVKHEVFGRKKPLTTSVSEEEQIKTVSSTHPKDRNILGNHQKPDISNGERAPLYKEIREDISKFVHKLPVGRAKLPIDDRPVSIITVAGENRGASMHLGSESGKKAGSVPIHRGYKIKSDEIPDTTTDGEGSSEGRGPRDGVTKNDQATKAYINNNTQSINNSILFGSSVNERNPGVQLVMSRNLAEPTKPTTKPETLEPRKAEFSVTPAENLTYQPTVRRRCLRGLFLEPSDSDRDNPEKPRRHGCLYNCKKSKDKDIGVL